MSNINGVLKWIFAKIRRKVGCEFSRNIHVIFAVNLACTPCTMHTCPPIIPARSRCPGRAVILKIPRRDVLPLPLILAVRERDQTVAQIGFPDRPFEGADSIAAISHRERVKLSKQRYLTWSHVDTGAWCLITLILRLKRRLKWNKWNKFIYIFHFNLRKSCDGKLFSKSFLIFFMSSDTSKLIIFSKKFQENWISISMKNSNFERHPFTVKRLHKSHQIFSSIGVKRI